MNRFSKLGTGCGAVAAAAALLAACGGGGGGSTEAQGTLRMAITDAPACGFEKVYVTVDRIEVNRSSTAAEDDGSWEKLVLTQPKRIDLLELTNGVLEELGSTPLPAGHYAQLRLVLAPNTQNDPLANAVVREGETTEIALDTPSGAQTGLKMRADIEVEAGKVADFVLDFDACKSVVPRGNAQNSFNLKPRVAILPRISTPGLAVKGYLDTALAGSATSVSLQQGGVVVRATAPMATDDPATTEDERGKFVLSPVPAGSYDLVITSAGRATAVLTGVPVTATAITTVNPATARIALPASATRTASGTVLTSATTPTPADALVRALQAIGTTAKVEVAAQPVNASTGAYSFSLPTAALVKAAYSATGTNTGFTADAATAGKYTLEAMVVGQTAQTRAIDLASANAEVSFTFATTP